MNVRILIGVLLALVMQSCFTGVESTPRITARELKRQKVVVTPEMEFLTDIAAPQPAQWQPGRQLLVTDSRLGHVLHPATVAVAPGDVLQFEGFRPVATPRSAADLEAVFTVNGQQVAYRSATDYDALPSLKRLDIPYTIDLQQVQQVRDLIKDKSYYTMSSLWYEPETFEPRRGTKYTPVQVVDVRPGTASLPFAVVFRPEGSSDLSCMLMTAGDGVLAVRNFHTLLSFTDIRQNYPLTTDANWQLITQGRLAEGMTMQECRLAVGSPEQIIQGTQTEGTLQRWSYPDGVYLIFDDGILTKFRQ